MWDTLKGKEVEQKLKTDTKEGLTDEEIKKRKEKYGKKGSKLLKAWAVEKTMSDEEFSKQSDELHKTVQDKEDALSQLKKVLPKEIYERIKKEMI